MLRNLLAGLGLIFTTLLVFSASFVGNVAADIDSRASEHERLAVEAVRRLSVSWSLADIEPLYTADARDELAPVLRSRLDGLKGLGLFLYADDTAVEARWQRPSHHAAGYPEEIAERLADLINRCVKVTFVGKFAGGHALVTAELKREGGRMKLWRLRIEGPERTRPDGYPGQRVISFA